MSRPHRSRSQTLNAANALEVGTRSVSWLCRALFHVAFHALCFAARPGAAAAQEWSSSRPDGHAPLGVMGDHTHEKGEVMFSYRFMPMRMEGNLVGADRVDTVDVLRAFPVTPLRMPMSMHMFSAMVAPADRLTLMGMVPILDGSMDHLTRTGSVAPPVLTRIPSRTRPASSRKDDTSGA